MLTGFALDRPFVGKDFHAVDQLHDAVGLVADQRGERAVFSRPRTVRAVARRREYRTSGFLISCASMAASAITERAAPRCVSCRSILSAIVRSCSMIDDVVGGFRHRRDVQIDQPLAGRARRRQIDLVFVDGGAAMARPARSASTAGEPNGTRSRSVFRRSIGIETSKNCFGGDIGVGDLAVGPDNDHWMRQSVEHWLRPRLEQDGTCNGDHSHAVHLHEKHS